LSSRSGAKSRVQVVSMGHQYRFRGCTVLFGEVKETPAKNLCAKLRGMTQPVPPKARGKARAFVSYARSDGESFAGDLMQRLQAEGIPLWRDHEGMVGGRDFWQQITEAIASVDVLILVMTPAAAQSDMVRREWRHARKEGVVVYPVLASPEIGFKALPHWMRSVHFYDPETEWPKFVHRPHFAFIAAPLFSIGGLAMWASAVRGRLEGEAPSTAPTRT